MKRILIYQISTHDKVSRMRPTHHRNVFRFITTLLNLKFNSKTKKPAKNTKVSRIFFFRKQKIHCFLPIFAIVIERWLLRNIKVRKIVLIGKVSIEIFATTVGTTMTSITIRIHWLLYFVFFFKKKMKLNLNLNLNFEFEFWIWIWILNFKFDLIF